MAGTDVGYRATRSALDTAGSAGKSWEYAATVRVMSWEYAATVGVLSRECTMCYLASSELGVSCYGASTEREYAATRKGRRRWGVRGRGGSAPAPSHVITLRRLFRCARDSDT
eukprot:3112168-Rhodomonas_salina.2